MFSPHDVPGLYDAFGTDRFDDLYVGFERDESIPRKTIGAQKLILDILKERAETGRLYIMNIDHCNSLVLQGQGEHVQPVPGDYSSYRSYQSH